MLDFYDIKIKDQEKRLEKSITSKKSNEVLLDES